MGRPVGDSGSLGVVASLYYMHVQFKTLENCSTNLCFWSEEDD